MTETKTIFLVAVISRRGAGIWLFALLLLPPRLLQAQGFQALHGSAFAGSMATDYNPASVLDAPYRWDVTLFGLQTKNSTNSFNIHPYSLLKPPAGAVVKGREGTFARYLHSSSTLHLLHAMYRLNTRSAVSLGFNLRHYVHGDISPVNWQENILSVQDFVALNGSSTYLQGNMQTSSWGECNLGYSRILQQNELGRWQAGVQLRILRALSGGFVRVNNIYLSKEDPAQPAYRLVDGSASYGYSSNYDAISSKLSTGTNIRNFLQDGQLGLGADLGVEYVRYPNDFSNAYEPGGDPADYTWKIAISLLDIGRNRYAYGRNSMAGRGVQPGVYASTLDQKFDGLDQHFNLDRVNDSIRTIVNVYDSLRGDFSISNPLRLLVNFDQHFPRNLYLNASLQLHFNATRNANRVNTRELTVLAITPRWETPAWGLYLPIQYTTQGNTWIGLAAKAGPLVMGLHHLGWLFGQSALPNGGGYLALQVHPWKNRQREKDGMDCPRW